MSALANDVHVAEDSATVSRRSLFSAAAVVAGAAALGVTGAAPAQAAVPTATAVSIRKVAQYRALA